MRPCSACDIKDDGPRDVIWGDEEVMFHIDCHAAMGCKTCLDTYKAAGGKKDAELRAFITGEGE